MDTILVITACVVLTSYASEVREYCQWETFDAKCGQDEVIVMKTARYGRLRLGRCVKQDFGYLGCATDVLPLVDKKCSGQTTCRIDVYKTFRDQRPCLELESHFQASYTCVKNSGPVLFQCDPSQEVTVNSRASGILASGSPIPRGSHNCPYRLRSDPGRRWKIRLVDFSVAPAVAGDRDMPSDGHPLHCLKYARINEPLHGDFTVCGGHVREQTVYISESNVVNIQLYQKKDTHHFLLKYSAFGCAHPAVPEGAWMRREEDRTRIFCNFTDQKWDLQCKQDVWVGQTGICTNVRSRSWSLWLALTEDWSTPHGITIVSALGVSLGIVFGFVMLATTVLVLRRRSRLAQRKSETRKDHNGYPSMMKSMKGDTVEHARSGLTMSGDQHELSMYGTRPSTALSVTDTNEDTTRVFSPLYSDSSGYGTTKLSTNSSQITDHTYEIPI